MSTDLNAKITLSGLKYYHGKIQADVLTPVHDILYNNATDSDIGRLFEKYKSNTIYFSSIVQDCNIVLKDSEGNTVTYDDSGSITLQEGSYSLLITRDDDSNINKYSKVFVADNESYLNISDPVLYSSFPDNGKNAEGISIEFSIEGGIAPSGNYSRYFNVKENNSAGTITFDVGGCVIFNSDNKLIVKAIDFSNGASSDEDQLAWVFSLWGSDDGENWTRIAENSTVSTVNPVPPSLYGSRIQRFLRVSFNDPDNHGYLCHKIVLESRPRYGGLGAMWLSEAYWVD